MVFTIVTLGDLVADIAVMVPALPLEQNRYQEAYSVSLEPGGAGNFLITGSRLGMHMIAIGALGDDTFGHHVGAALLEEGVDMALVDYPAGSTTTTVLVLNDDAGHTVMTGAYGSGQPLKFNPAWEDRILLADAVFAFGYSLREHRIQSAVLTALEYAHAAGRPVFFDPGPEFNLVDHDTRDRALSSANVILLTEEEVAVTGATSPAELLCHSSIVVVKRGAGGSQIWGSEGTVDVAGFPVDIRDVAGAGDCFAAAFVYGYLSCWPIQRIATFANATGAAKVKKRGTGRQVPTADEVRAVLFDHRSPYTF